jgi:hypothetical protein
MSTENLNETSAYETNVDFLFSIIKLPCIGTLCTP